jgi:hypothetical protein
MPAVTRLRREVESVELAAAKLNVIQPDEKSHVAHSKLLGGSRFTGSR